MAIKEGVFLGAFGENKYMANPQLSEKELFRFSDWSSLTLHLIRGGSAQAVVFGHALSFFGITQGLSLIQNSGVVVFFYFEWYRHTLFCHRQKGN